MEIYVNTHTFCDRIKQMYGMKVQDEDIVNNIIRHYFSFYNIDIIHADAHMDFHIPHIERNKDFINSSIDVFWKEIDTVAKKHKIVSVYKFKNAFPICFVYKKDILHILHIFLSRRKLCVSVKGNDLIFSLKSKAIAPKSIAMIGCSYLNSIDKFFVTPKDIERDMKRCGDIIFVSFDSNKNIRLF